VTDRVELPRLALVLGDMTGIGPEICARALYDGRIRAAARLAIVGDARVLDLGIRDAGISLPYRRIEPGSPIDWAADEIPLIDLENIDPATVERGAFRLKSAGSRERPWPMPSVWRSGARSTALPLRP
jgi:4-hydroxy-L-threonine phosphate dehydrogenase PdxA